VNRKFPNAATQITWYTTGATYRPGKDIDHPLNPMRGYLGKSKAGSSLEEDKTTLSSSGITQYDLVYILDAIYHFQPEVPYFVHQVLPALSPGGVLAYTDILPPPSVNPILGYFVMPTFLSVPSRNILNRPRDLAAYQAQLEGMGYVNVTVEDWSDGVWPGFSRNLQGQGGIWKWVGKLVSIAESNGWKYIGVRAERPADVDES
jgi:hypothetical protein